MRLSPVRPGLSLMEIIISLTIFVLSFLALGQLIGFGADRAVEIQMRSQAAQMCQSKLAEVTVGAVPLQSQGAAPFDEDPDWQWTLDAEQGSVSGLYTVQVKVFRPRSDGSEIAVTLSRMVLDPSLRGSAFDQPATISGSSSTTDSGSSNAGSGSTSSGSGQNTQGGQSSPSGGSSPAPSSGASTPSGGPRPASTPTPSAPPSGGPSGGRATPSMPSTGGSTGGGRATPSVPSTGGAGGLGGAGGAGARGR